MKAAGPQPVVLVQRRACQRHSDTSGFPLSAGDLPCSDAVCVAHARGGGWWWQEADEDDLILFLPQPVAGHLFFRFSREWTG
jgi:hypothetical protein